VSAAAHVRFWLIAIILFGLGVWLLRGVLMPFFAGMVIAYMLDPVADRFEAAGAPRWLATTLVLLSFLLVIVAVLVVLVPVISAQVGGLLAALPEYATELNEALVPLFERFGTWVGMETVEDLRGALGRYAGDAVTWLGRILGGLWRGGLAIIDILSLLVITPVVAFYMLRDWDRMVATVDSYLPRAYADTIRMLAGDVNRTLASFMRGQALVCLILGTVYAIGLSIVGLNFGILVGLGAGLISFVPYVGSIVGFVTSMGIALVQFDSWVMWAAVGGIFVGGQAVEGNFLTPKLVGGSVGLHPVWVLFALLAGGSLFGFTGILIAVPVAAVVGVLVRFFLRRYRESPYFLAPGPGAEAEPEPGPAAADAPRGEDDAGRPRAADG
jgi:predicted PurR-regulated permease PerM